MLRAQERAMAVSVNYLYLKLKPRFPEISLSVSAGAYPQKAEEIPVQKRPVLERFAELRADRGDTLGPMTVGPNTLLAAESVLSGPDSGVVTVDGVNYQTADCPPLLFFGENRPKVALPAPILVVPRDTARYPLYREIWQILNEHNRWLLDISEELIRSGSAEALLRHTSKLIDSPMYFADASFMMIASFGEMHLQAHWVLVYHLKHGYLPFEFLMKLIHTGELAEINESDHAVYISESRCFRLPYIAKVIHQGSRVMGYLVMVEFRHKFTDYELEIADRLGEILSDAPKNLAPWLYTERFLHEHFLLDIMNGGLENREDIQRQLHEFGWNVDDDYRLLVLSTKKTDSLISHNLISIFSSEWDAQGFTYKDLIVLVYHQPAEYLNKLRERLPPLFQEYRVQGAMSEEFCDFTQIKTFFRQAVGAMLLSEKYGKAEGLQLFDEYYLMYRAGLVAEKMPLYSAIQKMRRYDLENDTDYCQTLYEYLRCGNNIVTAAKNLFLHRNTMNYRMNKIRELFGVDLDNPNVRERCLDSLGLMMSGTGKTENT